MRVVGVDLFLVFEDGSKILLPSMALDLSSPQAPQLYFGEEQVTAEALFAEVGAVEISENVSNLAITNVTTTSAVAEADPQPQVQPAPTLEGSDFSWRRQREDRRPARAVAGRPSHSANRHATAPGGVRRQGRSRCGEHFHEQQHRFLEILG